MRFQEGEKIKAWLLSILMVHSAVAGNPDAKRLYDDLLSNYNKLVRPVVNTTDVLKVCIKLKLSQLIDVVSIKENRNFLMRYTYSAYGKFFIPTKYMATSLVLISNILTNISVMKSPKNLKSSLGVMGLEEGLDVLYFLFE